MEELVDAMMTLVILLIRGSVQLTDESCMTLNPKP